VQLIKQKGKKLVGILLSPAFEGLDGFGQAALDFGWVDHLLCIL
jgi:hypothetical protein